MSEPLDRRLAARIARHGPMTVAEFMGRVLTDPQQGYYMSGDPFGARGDFVTAPEISQMFGELLGLWCAETWQRLGAPDPVLLVELGPGRGTLMADALRAAGALPAFRQALRLHLVEISPALRRLQAETLSGQIEPANTAWHDNLFELPEQPMLLLANEFFDALPIRQFERAPEGWCERLVVCDAEASNRLAFALSPPSPHYVNLLPESLRGHPPGSVAELCPSGLAIAEEIGRRLAAHGGAALIIDYGAARPSGRSTLQAVRRHAPQNVLESPGTADLTAHVDFGALASAAEAAGAATHGPLAQGAFLRQLGIAERAAALSRNAKAAQEAGIQAALARLTDPAEMGEHFQVLAVTAGTAAVPAGFA